MRMLPLLFSLLDGRLQAMGLLATAVGLKLPLPYLKHLKTDISELELGYPSLGLQAYLLDLKVCMGFKLNVPCMKLMFPSPGSASFPPTAGK